MNSFSIAEKRVLKDTAEICSHTVFNPAAKKDRT